MVNLKEVALLMAVYKREVARGKLEGGIKGFKKMECMTSPLPTDEKQAILVDVVKDYLSILKDYQDAVILEREIRKSLQ
jgi:hypothetical protein